MKPVDRNRHEDRRDLLLPPSASPVTAVTVTSLVMSVPQLVMNCLLPLMTQCPSSSLRRRPGRARVGSAARLGQTERAQRLATCQQRQPFLLLVLVAEPVDRHRAKRHTGLERDGDALVDLAEFFERKAQREVVAAHAAVLLGKRQAEEPHIGHPRDDFVRERVLFVVLGGDRRNHALREVAHGLGELLVVIGQHARWLETHS